MTKTLKNCSEYKIKDTHLFPELFHILPLLASVVNVNVKMQYMD